MFKLYASYNDNIQEIYPVNGIYNIVESFYYEFEFYDKDVIGESVFLEDVLIDNDFFHLENNRIKTIKSHSFFQDFFGLCVLRCGAEEIILNVLVEKIKLNNLENIVLYIWNQDHKLFNVFYGEKFLNENHSRVSNVYNAISKYIAFCSSYLNVFNNLYSSFRLKGHKILRKNIRTVEYSPKKVSSHTISWLLSNLDRILLTNNYGYDESCISLGGKLGYIDKIETADSCDTFDVYENQIILGAFLHLLSEVNSLILSLQKIINSQERAKEKPSYDITKFADFRDLKVFPFVKAIESLKEKKKKIRQLFIKYSRVFKDTQVRKERPQITRVFAGSRHYMLAYNNIKKLYEKQVQIDFELKLFHIKKLSELYEVYNLFVMINGIEKSIKSSHFDNEFIKSSGLILKNRIDWVNEEFAISLYYNHEYPSSFTKLVRIDTTIGGHYCPDYVIHLYSKKNKDVEKYLILDAKYTKLYTLEKQHLPSCIYKYILNTGIENKYNSKPDLLALIYPGKITKSIVDSNIYSPQIHLIASSPESRDLELLLRKKLNQVLDKKYLIE